MPGNDGYDARMPLCPVCRLLVPTNGVYKPPNGFYEVFAPHGCDGDGRKVKDSYYDYPENDWRN